MEKLPEGYAAGAFSVANHLYVAQFVLNEEERMHLRGRIPPDGHYTTNEKRSMQRSLITRPEIRFSAFKSLSWFTVRALCGISERGIGGNGEEISTENGSACGNLLIIM